MDYYVHPDNKDRYKYSKGLNEIIKKLNISKILKKLAQKKIEIDTYAIDNENNVQKTFKHISS